MVSMIADLLLICIDLLLLEFNHCQKSILFSCQLAMPVHECRECGLRCQDPHNLHLLTHSDRRPYFECHVCSCVFTRVHCLQQHISTIHGKRRFECDICGKEFTQAGNLRRHILTVHKKERRFECQHCGRKFGEAAHFRTHISSVHEKARFKCDKCDKEYSHSSDLRLHKKSIHENATFRCEKCDRRSEWVREWRWRSCEVEHRHSRTHGIRTRA